MTPYKSLEDDDCVRTCIAMLLDMEPALVPHIFEGNPNPTKAWEVMSEFLRKHGWSTVTFGFQNSLPDLFDMMEFNSPNAYYMLLGSAPMGNHAVVCRGGRMVADPSWQNGGIIAPLDDGTYQVQFLVPLAMTNL